MGPYLRIVRAGNVGVSLAGTIVGGLSAEGHGLSVSLAEGIVLVLAAGSTACVTAAGNVLNDLGDRESDRVNHPERPLVTGAISMAAAYRLTWGLFVASILLIVPVAGGAPLLVPVLASALAVVWAYERSLKSRGVPGNAAVAYLTAAVFLYGGAAVGHLEVMVPFAAMAFAATLSREIIKDMEDAGGDLDRRTLPRTHGPSVASGAARASVAVALLLSPVPLVTFLSAGSSGGIMYLALVLAADALFVLSVVSLPQKLHREQTVSKGAMTVALVAFLAAAFR